MQTSAETDELLRRTRIEVAAPTFYLVGLRPDEWRLLLENPELSPRADAHFMFLNDGREVTLLVEEEDWLAMRHAVRDARTEGGFRLLTCDVVLPWNVVGFLARVTELLASAGIPVGALSAFSRDHLLVKQENLAAALRVLGPHVDELC